MAKYILVFLVLAPLAWGEEIVFLNKGLSIESQLLFFWRKIPFDQIKMEGEVAHVTGTLDLSLHRLPGQLRAALKTRLIQVLNGEERVSDMILETSNAHITFSDEGRFAKAQRVIVEKEPEPEPHISSRCTDFLEMYYRD